MCDADASMSSDEILPPPPAQPPTTTAISMPLPPGVPPPPGYVAPPDFVPPASAGVASRRGIDPRLVRVVVAAGAVLVAVHSWHQSRGDRDYVTTTYTVLLVAVLVAGAALALAGRRFGFGLVVGSVAGVADGLALWWSTTATRRPSGGLELIEVLGFAGVALVGVGVATNIGQRRRADNMAWILAGGAVAAAVAVMPYVAVDNRELVAAPSAIALLLVVCFLGTSVGRGVAAGVVATSLIGAVTYGERAVLPGPLVRGAPLDWNGWQVTVHLLCIGLLVVAFVAARGEPDIEPAEV